MRTTLIVAGLVAAATFVTWPSFATLFALWSNIPDYEHGLPLAAIAASWVFIAARQVHGIPLRPSWVGSLLLAGALFVWLVAHAANSQFGHQLLAPAVIWSTVLAATGWRIARDFVAPVAFLYFTIPVWDYAVPVLQWMSVEATEAVLGIAGVPVVVREYTVTIPSGTFQIVEGCSGKRYFMVTLAVACLAAKVSHLRGARALAFVLASGALAVFANWIRIVVVIYAGYVTEMQHYLVAVEHKTFGNAVFVVLLLVVFLLARVVAPPQPAALPPGAQLPAAGARSNGLPWRAAVPVVLLAVAFGIEQARAAAEMQPPTLGPLPFTAERWQGPLPAAPQWQPKFLGASAERRAAYASEGGTVELYVNAYGVQRQGAELVFYGNSLLSPGEWSRPWPLRQGTVAAGAAPPLLTMEAIGPDGGVWMIAHAYQVGATQTRHEHVAQLLYGVRSLIGAVPSGMVALASRCSSNCDAARALVESFWGEMSTQIRAMWPSN